MDPPDLSPYRYLGLPPVDYQENGREYAKIRCFEDNRGHVSRETWFYRTEIASQQVSIAADP